MLRFMFDLLVLGWIIFVVVRDLGFVAGGIGFQSCLGSIVLWSCYLICGLVVKRGVGC